MQEREMLKINESIPGQKAEIHYADGYIIDVCDIRALEDSEPTTMKK